MKALCALLAVTSVSLSVRAAELACPAGQTWILSCRTPDTAEASDDPRAVAFMDAAIACKMGDISTFDEARVYYRDSRTQRVSPALRAQEVMVVGSSAGGPPAAVSTFEVKYEHGPHFYLSYNHMDDVLEPRTRSSATILIDGHYRSRSMDCEYNVNRETP